MKNLAIILIVIIVLIFLGGAIRVGGDSLLGHVDSALGITALSDTYYTLFFFMRRGVQKVESEYTKTDEDLKDFQQRPLGFDKKKKYKDLDAASHY